MDKSILFDDFMKISNFFFKFLGVFPYNDSRKTASKKEKIIMELVFWANFVNLNIAVLAEIVYIFKVMKELSGFLEVTALAPCIGFCLLSQFKLLWLWSMSEDILALTDGLQYVFPTEEKSQRIFKMNYYLKTALKLGFVYSLVLSFTIWAFNLIPLVASLLEFYTSSDVNKEFQWRLAYITWYPFEINTIPIYAAVYISHIGGGCTAAGGFFACDIFMFNLIILICMNFNYIERNLGQKSKTINDLIRHHQIILELSKIMNEVFSMTILVNFISSIFIICLVLFQVTVDVQPLELFKYILFLTFEIVQISALSYLGDYMTSCSENIGFQAFDQEWWEEDFQYQKKILMIITRSQVPVALEAKGFGVVSLQSFSLIMTKSYQFFVCLRYLYNK